MIQIVVAGRDTEQVAGGPGIHCDHLSLTQTPPLPPHSSRSVPRISFWPHPPSPILPYPPSEQGSGNPSTETSKQMGPGITVLPVLIDGRGGRGWVGEKGLNKGGGELRTYVLCTRPSTARENLAGTQHEPPPLAHFLFSLFLTQSFSFSSSPGSFPPTSKKLPKTYCFLCFHQNPADLSSYH